MKFQRDKAIEQVKKPTNSTEVERGKIYESRLRVFTEPKEEDELKEEEGWKIVKDFMSTALSKERDVRITEFIQYPLSVCGITEGIMSDVYKVFNAGNSYFSIETVKHNGGEKIEKIFEKLNLNRWIEDEGKEVLRNKPNTIVVVDKNNEGEPYLIPVTNDRLIDFKTREDEVHLEYIAFIHSITTNEAGEEEKRIAFYDDETYFVFLVKGSEYIVEKEVKHNIGTCPARFFIKRKLNNNGSLNRRSPLSLVLSKLQEWQLFDIYKFYTDHYAPFPIVEMVRAKCGDDRCTNGKIYEENEYFEGDVRKTRPKITDCPVCANSNQIGVGAKIMLDPQEENSDPTASGKFRMINNDVSQLEYLKTKLSEIETYIQLKAVGTDDILSNEAVNELQVKGSFESKTNVLLAIKTNLDELYEWIANTVAKTVLSNKEPLTVNANFGTEWYLVGENELQKRFKEAKTIGLPKEEVDMIYYQLIETKYKGNPNKISRLKIINRLDPCPYDLTNDKVNNLKNGIISKKELIISEKLITFVKRFELEQGSIVEFGANLEPKKKFEQINKIINSYADEYIKANSTEPIRGSEKTDE